MITLCFPKMIKTNKKRKLIVKSKFKMHCGFDRIYVLLWALSKSLIVYCTLPSERSLASFNIANESKLM